MATPFPSVKKMIYEIEEDLQDSPNRTVRGGRLP
jgi:hypothetical protein